MTSIPLLITSGDGPAECRLAVGHAVTRIAEEATASDIDLDIATQPAKHGLNSAIIILKGSSADMVAQAWEGVILWRCRSALRPHHKRRNWFIQVFRAPERRSVAVPDFSAVSFQAMRAGGPGGQHQNTTASAVRAKWRSPSGADYEVVVRSQRSQHQNKREALERLAKLADLEASLSNREIESELWAKHHQLQRGDPARIFDGAHFIERK